MDAEYYKKYEPLFGEWTISRKIGEGSFGTVFEIERRDMGGAYKAALKAVTVPQSQAELESVMADNMDKKSTTEYFRGVAEEIVKEFVLMSKLKGNSNIVSYEDHTIIQHKDGVGWDILIRMELLTPLLSYIQTEKLKRRDVIKLGIDICKALELCQKYNIIHRDIKPENIFVAPSGDFKLGDFGIARTIDKTTSGLSKKGTYSYMAPEIYCGAPYGTSVDIYSLGIVLYRLLNENRTPFLPDYPAPITHNDREAALSKRMSGAPLPKPKNADAKLAEIVLKACAYDPRDRYQGPIFMRQELESILYSGEEAHIIYPAGDVADIKSLRYVKTGEERPRENTAGPFASPPRPAGGERPARGDSRANFKAEDGTVSPFGGARGGRPGGEVRRQPAAPPGTTRGTGPAPAVKPRKKYAAVIIAAVLVVLAGAGFLTYHFLQTRREEQYNSLLQQASETYTSDFDQSESELYDAMALLPDRVEAYRQYAYALYLNGKYQECIDFAADKADKFSDDELKLILASSYFEMADYENAGDLYYAVANNNEDSLSVENLRDYAVCLGRMGKLDEAAAVFVMLTDKGATPDVTDYVLGETYYDKKDYANAEKSLLSALNKTTDDALKRRIYNSLAETYRESGEYDKSIATINEAVATPQFQNNPVLYEMLGAAYYAKAEAGGGAAVYSSAAKAFQKVIDLGVQKSYLYVNIYASYVKANNYSAAEKILADMEKAFPQDYTPHALMATVLIMEENKKSESGRDYKQAYKEYQTAKGLLKSTDDQTQMQQLEGLIDQLRSGGWIN